MSRKKYEWEIRAIRALKNLDKHKRALIKLEEDLEELESRIIKTSQISDVPSHGNGQGYSVDVNYVSDKDFITKQITSTRFQIASVERCLGLLPDRERRILEVCYVDNLGNKNPIYYLMYELNYREAQMYRMRSAALEKFATEMYGLLDYTQNDKNMIKKSPKM